MRYKAFYRISDETIRRNRDHFWNKYQEAMGLFVACYHISHYKDMAMYKRQVIRYQNEMDARGMSYAEAA